MKRTIATPYFLLGFCLFCWISLPKTLSDGARSFTVASLAPFWKWGERTFLEKSYGNKNETAELQRLQLENQNLRTQLETVHDWLLYEQRIADQVELFKELSQKEKQTDESKGKSFFQRRAQHLKQRLLHQLTAFPSQVIYRDPSSWSSSIWIDAGEDDNQEAGFPILAKNSPVVSGGALVGVVDFVGKKQSRVRLITDSGLSPAVRAVRNGWQNRDLAFQLKALCARLGKREDLFSSSEEKETFLNSMKNLESRMGKTGEEEYLAKGELHGSSAPFWRSRGISLKGIGFNFDYPDEEGPSRDLKNGRPTGNSAGGIPLLKEGDLLVTSGLDGVFPQGLLVATVSSIAPLKEGSYAYEIEARPLASNLNDLQTVFILPSLSSE